MVSETRYGALEIVGSTTTTTTIIVGSITIHKLVQAKIITHTIGLHRPCMHYNKYYRGNIYKTSALARHKPLYGGGGGTPLGGYRLVTYRFRGIRGQMARI